MFVKILLLVFVLLPSSSQAADLSQLLSSFVTNTLGNKVLSASPGATLTVISASTDKAAIAATIAANLYGLNTETKQIMKLQVEDVPAIEAALEDGASVVEVHWGLKTEEGETSATTYAIVSADSILESVTKTYTKRAPTSANSKLQPQQGPPSIFPSKYHATFWDWDDNEVANFDAQAQCTAVPSCAITAVCTDTRAYCSCQSRSRVECAAPLGLCYAEVAFVGFCGSASTLAFDEKTFQYTFDNTVDLIYHSAYVKLSKKCACKPPK